MTTYLLDRFPLSSIHSSSQSVLAHRLLYGLVDLFLLRKVNEQVGSEDYGDRGEDET